jgi:hypothetical protein
MNGLSGPLAHGEPALNPSGEPTFINCSSRQVGAPVAAKREKYPLVVGCSSTKRTRSDTAGVSSSWVCERWPRSDGSKSSTVL